MHILQLYSSKLANMLLIIYATNGYIFAKN